MHSLLIVFKGEILILECMYMGIPDQNKPKHLVIVSEASRPRRPSSESSSGAFLLDLRWYTAR